MLVMPPKKPARLAQLSISLIKGTPAAVIGYVDAPDAESAIKKAIKEFEIKDPQKQRRLIAQLWR
jgi:hypothetical protein